MTQRWHVSATFRRPQEVEQYQRDLVVRDMPGYGTMVDHGQTWIDVGGDIEAPDIQEAFVLALAKTRSAWSSGFAGRNDPAKVTVVSAEAYENDLSDQAMDLIGITEVGEILAVSKQRASQIVSDPSFPAPVAHPAMGRIFLRRAVEVFADDWRTRRGDGCAHLGCHAAAVLVVGGLPYCSREHVPAELRSTV